MNADPTAPEVAQDVVNKVTDGIEALVGAMKSVAPHAWDVLVRQQRAEGVTMLVIGLVGVIVCAMLHRKNLATNYESDRSEPFSPGAKKVFVGAFIVLANIYPVVLTATGALQVYNPEYYAAMELLEKTR